MLRKKFTREVYSIDENLKKQSRNPMEDNSNNPVVGFGEITYDHIFHETDDALIYIHSRGGGTVWNILANLARLNRSTHAIGVYGEVTPYGYNAKLELNKLGVNTNYLVPVAKKATRLIFQLVDKRKPQKYNHKFTRKCPICGNKRANHELAVSKHYRFKSAFDWRNQSVLVVDNITKDRLNATKKAKEINPNLLTVLDIGRIGHLRYQPIANIFSSIQCYDFIFIDIKTYESLLQRLGQEDDDLSVFFSPTSQLKLLVTLGGLTGLSAYFLDSYRNTHRFDLNPPNNLDIEDAAGAGDALIANTLNFLLKNYFDETDKRFKLDINAIRQSLKYSRNKILPVLSNVGARGHLPVHQVADESTIVQELANLTTNDIKGLIKDRDCCPYCFLGSTKVKRISRSKTSRRITSLNKIMSELPRRALFALERFEAISKCRKLLLEKDSTFCIVGTGGSYAAAQFISQVMSTIGMNLSVAMHPYDYYRGMAYRTDWLVVVSHSGKTPDCRLAIKRAKDIGVSKIVLITHPEKPVLGRELRGVGKENGDIVISYCGNQTPIERGFLSFAGSLIPCILFTAAALNREIEMATLLGKLTEIFKTKENACYEKIDEFVMAMSETKVVDLIGGGYAWPAMLDFESKAAEGGLCYIQLHESKNFSHGRFMLSLREYGLKIPKLLFQVDDDPYEELLLNTLKSKETIIQNIKAENGQILGGLELLVEAQYFIAKLSKLLFNGDRDISKPKYSSIPKEGLKLYHWENKFEQS